MPTMKMNPTATRHVSDPVSDAQSFRFQNGAVARSLVEFGDALAASPAWVAWYHREHFVPWVRDVLGDAPLARRLEHYAEAGGDAELYRETLVDLVARRIAEARDRRDG